MKKYLFFFFLLFSLRAFSQRYLGANEYHYSLNNRMDLLLIRDSLAGDQFTLNLTFQTGPFIETPDLNGFSYFYQKLFTQVLKHNIKELIPEAEANAGVITVEGTTTIENVTYQLTFDQKHFDKILQAIFKTLTTPLYNESLCEQIKQQIASEYEQLKANPEFSLHQKVSAKLWTDFAQRRTLFTGLDSLKNLEKKLEFIQTTYYCAKNGFMAIHGNFVVRTTLEKIRRAFVNLDKCILDPFIRYPVPVPKKLLYSVQTIDAISSSELPFYEISFQGPSNFIDKQGVHSAFILSHILKTPHSKLYKAFHDSTFIESLTMNTEALRNSDQISFLLLPDSNYVSEAYENFWKIMNTVIDSSYISTDGLEAAKKDIINQRHSLKTIPAKYVDLISQSWASSNFDEYGTFDSSVRSIQLQDLQDFIKRYVLENHFVAGLSISPEKREQMKIDSSFTPTATEVNSYQFHFLRNSDQFVNIGQDSILNSLIQFMKINPGLRIKVNGVAETNEYLQITDKEVIRFIKTLKNFEITPASLIPTKKIRLDVYRSMKIIKAMIEAGIDQKRVVGTGQLTRSQNPDPSDYRVYCTLIK